ncbi:hypothetical protein [Sphingomonas sp. Leaf33]|uniref:hypothetical protein n=1 Tax=Sphingomonas sp. Leaf33 TaxID=1736215 RepID=UPI000A4FC8A5|nr:hypothetical protein [Sphingomonas sp. Leaf33]
MTRAEATPPWLLLFAIAAIGLAVRVAAARGGLWLDEAWSAVFAADVATPAGVFLNIHHDNNHHLNTLWLQWVGIDADPLVQRALSIATGTAAIVVAALIVTPQGRAAAVIAALAFALSPILVTYGSEARGYAPMLLALLILMLVVGRWLDDPERPPPVIGLTIVCILGVLAQMTFIFAVGVVAGWVFLRRADETTLRRALIDTARAMAAPSLVTLAMIALIVRWLPGASGFTIGHLTPYSGGDLLTGQSAMLAYTFGAPLDRGWMLLPAGGVIAALALLPQLKARRWLYLLALVGVPLGCAIAHLGNVAIPRYFLTGAAAALLLVAEVGALALTRGGGWRGVAAAVLLVMVVGSVTRDAALIGNRRADPSIVVRVLRSAAPTGSTVSLDRERAAPVIQVAAAQAAYPVRIVPCGRFLFVDRDGDEPFPAAPTRCGLAYRPIVEAHPTGLSGTHWTLYERRP